VEDVTKPVNDILVLSCASS